MANYLVLRLSESLLWREYLNRLPIEQQDIYFTPEYYQLYEQNGEGETICFIFEHEGNFALYPFLKNEINVLGFDLDKKYYDIQGAYGYNGVVSTTNECHFVEEFYKSFNTYCRNAGIVAEFTRFHALIGNQDFSKKYIDVIFDRKTVCIDLSINYEDIFSKFQTTTRKQVKRAINRYKIEVRSTENDLSLLDTFLNIYHSTMDRVASIPYLYFNGEYVKQLIEKTPNVCLVAYYENKPIAVIIAFYNQHYIHGHLGGALIDYLPMSPYSLLYSEMIRYGQKKGCRYLHVGGGATSNPDDSLLKYKLNFSNTTLDFYIGKKIHNKKIYDLIVDKWETKFPEKREVYKNLLLKYRF